MTCRSPDRVATMAQLAALLEASAPKPGNVSPGRRFHDTSYEDFLASAAAIGPALRLAGERPLGATILAAVEATIGLTGVNTNLGIVLLLAPLARAALLRPGATALRESLRRVLAETTVEDAEATYAAIRLARPGGLGRAAREDVAAAPTIPLRETMRLAADRDTVAREYVTDFAVTFEVGWPAAIAARRAGLSWPEATVETFLAILAAVPDTLVARKLGRAAAEAIARRAAEIAALGGVRSEAGRRELARFDEELRDPRNTRNPGTTADLTAAALFVALLEVGWDPARRGGYAR
ncbi:MAG TPA: triphosphoribosyl-dephospho-CoA synthase [Gemmatimonadales bacterium]|nr:triphosphoribosyl-dephospho-CoA synthase [Gemmatimonadales bacterium]